MPTLCAAGSQAALHQLRPFGLGQQWLGVNDPAWHSTHDMALGQSSVTQVRSCNILTRGINLLVDIAKLQTREPQDKLVAIVLKGGAC